jgi:hypothetical protein
MRKLLIMAVAICGCCLMSIPALAQKGKPSLEGSPESIARMAEQAKLHDYSRLSTGKKIMNFFRGGLLVELKGNGNYRLDGVSYPFVRREVKLFVERFSAQSRNACTDGLTVTSGSRPANHQPSNASKRSVHPNGMAVDFRIPDSRRCRVWLESTLLSLEGARVLEATREKSSPHYHVAVFPNPYKEYLERKKEAAKKAAKAKVEAPPRKR